MRIFSICLVFLMSLFATSAMAGATPEEAVRQFQHGRQMVAHCRYSNDLGCKIQALWWYDGHCCVQAVPVLFERGAEYQILVQQYDAGMLPLYLEVYEFVQETFKGDTDAYCAFFQVDCVPVLRNLAENDRLYKSVYAIGEKLKENKRRGQKGH